MARKKILLIMNCAATEIGSNLVSSRNITEQFDVEWLMTYVSADDPAAQRQIHDALKTADVLITQSVQNIGWLQNDALYRYAKPNCHLIRLAFWRFEGLWPVQIERQAEGLWYPPIEAGNVGGFEEYIGFDIPRATVVDHYEKCLDKLAEIDALSDFRMLGFVADNMRKTNLFTDSWHPTSYFFLEVTRYIFRQLGIDFDVSLRPNNVINRDRYRFVFDSVSAHLGLEYDPSILRFQDYWVTRKVFFEFCRFAATQPQLDSTTQTAQLFESWRGARRLAERSTNLAPLGRASQSSLSPWSRAEDAQGAISGRTTGGFSFHTGLDDSPWWRVDLRDFREISSVVIWNRDADGADLRARAVPLTVSESLDGSVWNELATIHYPFGGLTQVLPLTLHFPVKVNSRHLRLQVQKPSYLHLDQVEVIANILA